MNENMKQQAGIGSNGLQATSSGATRLQRHFQTIDELASQLDRACLQYDNLLRRLRGNVPEEVCGVDSMKAQVDPPLMENMEVRMSECNSMVNQLNYMADELNEYI